MEDMNPALHTPLLISVNARSSRLSRRGYCVLCEQALFTVILRKRLNVEMDSGEGSYEAGWGTIIPRLLKMTKCYMQQMCLLMCRMIALWSITDCPGKPIKYSNPCISPSPLFPNHWSPLWKISKDTQPIPLQGKIPSWLLLFENLTVLNTDSSLVALMITAYSFFCLHMDALG